MDALIRFGAIMALIVSVGIFASHCAGNERLMKRAAATLLAAILITLVFAIVRGDLLRYAPGAQDIDNDSGGSFR